MSASYTMWEKGKVYGVQMVDGTSFRGKLDTLHPTEIKFSEIKSILIGKSKVIDLDEVDCIIAIRANISVALPQTIRKN